MPVRSDVGATEKDVEESLRIVGGVRMKIVVHAPPLGCRGEGRDRLEQSLRDQSYF
jgi:hypothetical protein